MNINQIETILAFVILLGSLIPMRWVWQKYVISDDTSQRALK